MQNSTSKPGEPYKSEAVVSELRESSSDVNLQVSQDGKGSGGPEDGEAKKPGNVEDRVNLLHRLMQQAHDEGDSELEDAYLQEVRDLLAYGEQGLEEYRAWARLGRGPRIASRENLREDYKLTTGASNMPPSGYQRLEKRPKVSQDSGGSTGPEKWESEGRARRVGSPMSSPSRHLPDESMHSQLLGAYDKNRLYEEFADFLDARRSQRHSTHVQLLPQPPPPPHGHTAGPPDDSRREHTHHAPADPSSHQTGRHIAARMRAPGPSAENFKYSSPPQPPPFSTATGTAESNKDVEKNEPQDQPKSQDYTSSSAMGADAMTKKFGPRLEKLPEDKGFLRESPAGRQYFSQRIAHIAREEVFYPFPRESEKIPTKSKGEKVFTVNLATMQRMNLHSIQRALVALASDIYKSPEWKLRPEEIDRDHPNPERDGKLSKDWSRLKELMRDYCQACRDWDLIQNSTQGSGGRDPFLLMTDNPLFRKLMEDVNLLPHNAPGYSESKDLTYLKDLPGVGRHFQKQQSDTERFVQLFSWAVGGGLALIAPMLVMRLHHTLATQLVTTCVAVMLFALAIAAVAGGKIPRVGPIDLGPSDVLAATAAYAAVLVVFVSQSS